MESLLASESRSNKCFPIEKLPVTQDFGENNGELPPGGNRGINIPEETARNMDTDRAGLEGKDTSQKGENSGKNNVGINSGNKF